MQKLKELIKLSNLCNFQLFASSIEGNIRHQKLRNCWVAKKLMSLTSPVRVFRREFLRNHSMNWTQFFRENLNCYTLSIFRVFILLASSDSDKYMLAYAKSENKGSPIGHFRIPLRLSFKATLSAKFLSWLLVPISHFRSIKYSA